MPKTSCYEHSLEDTLRLPRQQLHKQVLGVWGRQVGHTWDVAAASGGSGITPVHLVAAMRDAGMLQALAGRLRAFSTSFSRIKTCKNQEKWAGF
jgi:hypothetical protein